jgi:hypothetical protein
VDNAVDELTPATAQFRPQPWLTAAAGLGTVGGIVLAWMADDAPSRLIFGIAALVLAAYAVGDLVFAPRLAADRNGVRVRAPTGRADLDWDQIDSVRADTRQRLGLRSTTLEIDTGQTVMVFSKRALGADPEFVAKTILAFAPPD